MFKAVGANFYFSLLIAVELQLRVAQQAESARGSDVLSLRTPSQVQGFQSRGRERPRSAEQVGLGGNVGARVSLFERGAGWPDDVCETAGSEPPGASAADAARFLGRDMHSEVGTVYMTACVMFISFAIYHIMMLYDRRGSLYKMVHSIAMNTCQMIVQSGMPFHLSH